MCCLAWIFACFSRISIGIFRRFHLEFSKGFMCVVGLGFLLVFFFFFWISIGFERDFYGELREERGRGKRQKREGE